MKLILQLQPDVKRIVVIGGTTEVDQAVINRVMQAANSFKDKIEFELWNNRSIDEILNGVKSLPPETVIFFTRMFRDGAGQAVISANIAQSIGKAANVPVYALTDAALGSGIVGGSVSDIARLGRRAGEVAHDVLSGTNPAAIPLEILSQGTPIFDWRALKRWNISEQQLPAGSVVRYRPITFWDQYKWLILAVLAISIIEAALIGVLLRERRRRRLTQNSLERRLRLEQLALRALRHFHQSARGESGRTNYRSPWPSGETAGLRYRCTLVVYGSRPHRSSRTSLESRRSTRYRLKSYRARLSLVRAGTLRRP